MRLTFTPVFFLLFSGVLRADGQAGLRVDAESMRTISKVRAVRKDNPAEAEKILKASLAEKRSPVILNELAQMRAEAGSHGEAIELFGEVVKRDPAFPAARKNLGRLLSYVGRHEDAVATLQAGIRREGYDPATCAALGRSFLQLARYVEAEQPIRYALMARSGDTQLLLSLAYVLYGQKRFRECEATAATTLERDATLVDAWLLLAQARVAEERSGDAIDALEAARLLNVPLDVNSLWTLGDLCFAQHLYEQARVVYEDALKKGEPAKGSLENVARAFLAVGDTEGARAFAQKLLTGDPENAAALLVVGQLALREKDPASARSFFERAVKAAPLDGNALIALGDLAAAADRLAEAVGYYRSARTLPAYEEQALRAEADFLLRRNRLAEALTVVRLLQKKYHRPAWDELVREIRLRVQEKERAE